MAMASHETASDVALAFLRDFWAADVDRAMTHCAPGAVWQFARSLPYARECDVREAVAAIIDGMFKSFGPDGFSIEVRNELSEGDEAVIEYSAHGETHDGRPYDNDYVMCITVRNGKVTSIRPHTDTLHLAKLLMGDTVGSE